MKCSTPEPEEKAHLIDSSLPSNLNQFWQYAKNSKDDFSRTMDLKIATQDSEIQRLIKNDSPRIRLVTSTIKGKGSGTFNRVFVDGNGSKNN